MPTNNEEFGSVCHWSVSLLGFPWISWHRSENWMDTREMTRMCSCDCSCYHSRGPSPKGSYMPRSWLSFFIWLSTQIWHQRKEHSHHWKLVLVPREKWWQDYVPSISNLEEPFLNEQDQLPNPASKTAPRSTYLYRVIMMLLLHL